MEVNMDNGAYLKYRQENPVVNTFLSTYEEVAMLPEKLTNEELVVVVVLIFLALYSVIALFTKYRKNKNSHQKT